MDVRVGDVIRYKQSEKATYIGKVIGIYSHHLVANVAPVVSTMIEKPVFGNPRPYNISICYRNLTDKEQLEVLYDEEAEERAG